MTLTLVIGNKNYSSWSLRTWLMLSEAGIPFEELRLTLDTPDFGQRIRQFSPAARVPVLMIDNRPVWDTLAIAETVAERWPLVGLWPDDAGARAHARSISAEMHSGFADLREVLPMNCRALGRRVTLPGTVTADIDRILDIWADCFRRYGAHGDWLFGSRFGIADAMFAPLVLRFRTYGIEIPDAASHYVQRLLKSEALQNWLVSAESEIEVLESCEVGQ